MKEQVLVVEEDGETLTGLYSDDLAGLGTVQEVTRASNVEYAITPGVTGWEVKLTQDPRLGRYRGMMLLDAENPVNPKRLYVLAKMGEYNGFKTRAEALAVEVQFLNKYILKG